MNLPANQVLALFNKALRKFSQTIQKVQTLTTTAKQFGKIEKSAEKKPKMQSIEESVEEELGTAVDGNEGSMDLQVEIPSVMSFPVDKKPQSAPKRKEKSQQQQQHGGGHKKFHKKN